jgi:hypothetical protein
LQNNGALRYWRQKHRTAGAFFMAPTLEIHQDGLKLALNGEEC